MKIIDRLKIYMDFKGISLNAFDKSIGASNGYIGRQIKNNASIGGDVIEKIYCIYSDLNLEWLIAGKGEMLKSHEICHQMPEAPNFKDLINEIKMLAIENERLKTEIDQMKSNKRQSIGSYLDNENEITRIVAEPKINK